MVATNQVVEGSIPSGRTIFLQLIQLQRLNSFRFTTTARSGGELAGLMKSIPLSRSFCLLLSNVNTGKQSIFDTLWIIALLIDSLLFDLHNVKLQATIQGKFI
jgi:hypothetical protein